MSALPANSNVAGVNLTAVDRPRDMAIYDFLPASIREQLQAAPHNYCSEQVLQSWRASGLTDGMFIRHVMKPKFEQDRNIQH